MKIYFLSPKSQFGHSTQISLSLSVLAQRCLILQLWNISKEEVFTGFETAQSLPYRTRGRSEEPMEWHIS
eukprot:29330_5